MWHRQATERFDLPYWWKSVTKSNPDICGRCNNLCIGNVGIVNMSQDVRVFGWMGDLFRLRAHPETAILAVLIVGAAQGRTHYFHQAKLNSIQQTGHEFLYSIDSPLGLFTVRYKAGHRIPRLNIGPIDVSIDPKAQAGDPMYFSDEKNKQYRAIIVERKSHPPPPPNPAYPR